MKETPREMPPMTKRQRRQNWWRYHWKPLLAAAMAFGLLGAAVRERLSRVEPDCTVALVTRCAPSPEEIAALREALEACGTDANGDGTVSVAVNDIQIDYASTDLDEAAVLRMRTNVEKLTADFYSNQSGIFLLDDPAAFQDSHHALRYAGGAEAPEGAADWERMVRPWSDCPAVAGLSFRNLDADRLWFARRTAEGAGDAFAGADALWDALFEK